MLVNEIVPANCPPGAGAQRTGPTELKVEVMGAPTRKVEMNVPKFWTAAAVAFA